MLTVHEAHHRKGWHSGFGYANRMSIPQTVVKMHATGNDFVVYFDPDGIYEPTKAETIWLCDRHKGIGADGILRLTHPSMVSDVSNTQLDVYNEAGSQWFMDYRNADGSLAEMCGNGTRAITLFAQRLGLAGEEGSEPFALATRAGVKYIHALGDDPQLGEHIFTVEMGEFSMGNIGEYEVSIPQTPGFARGTFVDMGNPHVVSVLHTVAGAELPHNMASATLPSVAALDLTHKPQVSPQIPSDQNVEFVEVDTANVQGNEGTATMRVHERGSGETLSCGTGLCATAVTLHALSGIEHWNIKVLGGAVRVDIEGNNVLLTGSATLVGEINLRP